VAKNLDFGLLLEIYGGMLTEKQRGLMENYYWEDLSLGEISQNRGITRQAVRDSVKRSEQLLEQYEAQLHLAEKIAKCRENCSRICDCADMIKKSENYDMNYIDTIKEIALETGDLF
jgi:hypothetical protein